MNRKTILVCFGLILQGCNGDSIEFVNSSNELETGEIHMQVAANVLQRQQDNQTTLEDYTALQINFMGQHKDGYFYSIELSENDALRVNVAGEEGVLTKQKFPDDSDPLAVRYIQEYDVTEPTTPFTISLNRARDAELHELPFTLPDETPFSVSAGTTGIALNESLTVLWSALPDTQYTLRFTFTCRYENETINYHLRYPNLEISEISSPFVFVPGDHLNSTEGLSDCTLTTFLNGKQFQEIPDSGFASQSLEVARQQAIVRLLILE